MKKQHNTIMLGISVFLVALLCLSMFLAFAPKVSAQTTDWWLMFMHDLNHSGSST